MDYNESLVYKELLENSEKLAQDIMTTIRRLGLDVNFTRDDLTLADGNCFFRGVLQQCRRTDVYSTLPDDVKVFVDNQDHYGFRRWVKDCVFASNHVRVQQETLQPVLPKPWDYSWSDKYMMKNGFWADHTIVQCTAWFLKKDLMIISEDNDDDQCVTTIPGNMDDPTVAIGPQICLGYASNHYQSLLPVDVVPNDCPCCKKPFKNVLHHLNHIANKACREFVGEELLEKWRQINADKSIKKMRRNYDDSGKHKEYQESYVESGKHSEAQHRYVQSGKHQEIQAKHVAKKKEEDYGGLKERQRKWIRTWRSSNDENARHRNFLEDSKYGPIFICICCHRKLSKNNVTDLNESQIKMPLENCIIHLHVYTNVIESKNGKEISPNNRYIFLSILFFISLIFIHILGTSVSPALDI